MFYWGQPQFYGVRAAAANLGNSAGNYTAEQFQEDFPQFFTGLGESLLPRTMLDEFIRQANAAIQPDKWLDGWRYAAGLYTAHYATLYLKTYAPSSETPGQAAATGALVGVVASAKLGQDSVTSAGNLLSGILRAFGERQPQTLFGNRFSQFVKEVSEVKFYHRIGRRNNWLATRLLVGAGYAYGNSEVMPYSEQFYIGGANSIRAFTIRSLGPGSYRPPADDRNGYLDQTGDFKLEANIEYRFGIMGRLNGAVFLDAGNIWLLKKDPKRPGAELKWKGFLNDIALGTGFGLRYDISYLVIRADLGIGLHTPYPNPDKKGYYNISSFKDGLGFHLAIGYPF